MPDNYVTLRELSKMLNMDTSNTRKYGKKMGFSFTKIRTPESRGQLTLLVSMLVLCWYQCCISAVSNAVINAGSFSTQHISIIVD